MSSTFMNSIDTNQASANNLISPRKQTLFDVMEDPLFGTGPIPSLDFSSGGLFDGAPPTLLNSLGASHPHH